MHRYNTFLRISDLNKVPLNKSLFAVLLLHIFAVAIVALDVRLDLFCECSGFYHKDLYILHR